MNTKTKDKNKNKNDIKTNKCKCINLSKITVSKLMSIFIVFLILLITITFIKTNITNYKLLQKILKTNHDFFTSEDLYIETYTYNHVNSLFETTKFWVKGNHGKTEKTHANNTTNITYYDREKNQTIHPQIKAVHVTDFNIGAGLTYSELPNIIQYNFSEYNTFENIKTYLHFSPIVVENIYNIPCYKVAYYTDYGYEVSWYDVKTLYPVKSLNDNYDTSYLVTKCPLTEEELTIDTTGYEYFDYTNIEPTKVN